MSDLPLSTSDVKQEVKIRMGETGRSSVPSKTVMQNWDSIVEKCGDLPALHQKKGEDTTWTTWTWKEYRDNVDAFGKSLLHIGFDRFDIVNILGFNSPEWFFANYGAVAAGGLAAGIYTTSNADACKYISDHSKAKVVVVEGTAQLDKYAEICKSLKHLKALVMYGPDSLPEDVEKKFSVPVYTFQGFLDLGKDVTDASLQERCESWKAGESCALIYTSGTTGPPKAVMITNDNITWTVQTLLISRTPKGTMDNTDVIVSYLPLSHIAAQVLDMHCPLETGAQVYFARPDALKGSIGQTLKEARPTHFFGVPRVYEKIYDKLQQVGRESTGLKKMLSDWAKGKAAAHWESLEYGSTTSGPYFLFLARILLSKVRVALGLDRCIAFYVGAAPIETKILKYFMSLDIPVMELFGQSECTGPHSINQEEAFKVGTVGRPMPGTESKMGEGGELCYRGRHIFAGYMGMPDKTKETIDSDGWLHSGDVVTIDDDNDPDVTEPSGFITITGRIKELIITAGGENIAPVLIEDQIKDALPPLSNVMVIGDKRKYLTALLCLEVEIGAADGVPTNKLAGGALAISKEIGSAATTTEDARGDPKWKEYIDKGIEKANGKAASRAQKIQKWTLLPSDFTEKGGELTPTLKLKRSTTADKYSDVIEKMYA